MLKLIYLVFAIDLLFMLAANCLWFQVKAINKSKGYKWAFIWDIWDFRNLRQVIASEQDLDKRTKYRAILLTLHICALAIVICTVLGGVLLWISEAPVRGRY